MELLILICCLAYFIFFGSAAVFLAKQKSRNIGKWLFLGGFFGPIAIIILGFSSDLNLEQKITDAVKKALEEGKG